MYKKLICLVLFSLAVMAASVNAAVTPITNVTITRVDNPGGAPNFWLESITVGNYTVSVLRLVTGVSEGVATAQTATYQEITNADNFDLNLFAARADENPPTHQIKELGGQALWNDTNGDNPDFFVFETGGNQPITIEAILPGGILGQSVDIPQTTWGDTQLDVTTSDVPSTPHNGQSISGVAFAITDLLDQNGNNLANSSLIEGIQISSDGYDPSCVCAVSSGKILTAYNPSPPDGSLHSEVWISLGWTSGDIAASHDVYLGDNFDDVNDGAETVFRGNHPSTFYAAGISGYAYPDGLVPGTTYYWRIDEVNEADPNSPWKGPVWSFRITPTKAYEPVPADNASFIDSEGATLSWTPGFGAKLHTVYFGDDFDKVANATEGTLKADTNFDTGPLEKGTTYYWRVDEFVDADTTHKGDVWSFKTIPDIPITDPDLVGWWKFDVGSGTIAIDWSGHGNNGTITNGAQWVDGYDGGALLFDGIDDTVEFANFVTPMQGTITFWLNPASVGPRGRILGGHDAFETYVENDVLANQLFAGGTDYLQSNATIPTNTWTHVALTYDGTSHQMQIYLNGTLDGESSHADDVWAGGALAFGHRAASNQEYYYGLLDDVRIYNVVLTPEEIEKTMRGDPLLAGAPNPNNGALVSINEALPISWLPGEMVAEHDVYFGTDRNAVEFADSSDTSGVYRGRQSGTNYTPPEAVEWGGGPYFWRIDQVNTDGTISMGRIWTFTVADFILIDDFEDYDIGNNEIWWAWKDGLGYAAHDNEPAYLGNGTGSAVGDETTNSYTEENIVHNGSQSMPYWFDNNKQGFAMYSEAELTLVTPRDWTEEGVAELSIWFRGFSASTGSFVEAPAGTFTMTGAGRDIWDEADEFHFAYKMLTGAGSIIARVESVEQTNNWAKAGVMIRETLDAGSKFAAVYITPTNADGTATNGCRFQARMDTDASADSDSSVATAEQMAIVAPYWVKLERDFAGKFSGYYSSNGTTWIPMVWNSGNIPMSSNVYVGLALTSHDPALTCQAVFTNVTTTSMAGQQWAHQDIGIVSNDPEPLYVAVSNAAGAPAVVVHDDPNAATIATWTEWVIPLSDFTDQGINLTNVDRIAIGLGTRGNTAAPGGSGKMFFDDIRLYRPRDAAE